MEADLPRSIYSGPLEFDAGPAYATLDMPDWLRRIFLRPLWVRVSYIYGEDRPTPDDYWAFLGAAPGKAASASRWPFRHIAALDGVGAWGLDDQTLTSEIAGDNWSVYLSELGDEGNGPSVGVHGHGQCGVLLSVDPPGSRRVSKTFRREDVDALVRVLRELAPLQTEHGAALYVQGKPVGSCDEAVAVLTRTLDGRIREPKKVGVEEP